MPAAGNVFVTFDLWETLLMDEPQLEAKRSAMRIEGLQKVLGDLGIKLPVAEIKVAYDSSAPIFQQVWRRNEHISTSEQIRIILEQTSLGKAATDDPNQVQRLLSAYVEPVLEVPPRLNEEALDTLSGMRLRVKKLGLISNTGRSPGVILRRLMTQYGIIDFFDATVFSDEAGCRKPDRGIFESAAILLGARIDQIVHVGDDPEADVWGAKQAGLKAIHFDYEVPEGFRKNPDSLFALSRADRRIPDSEIIPDARIKSLSEALGAVDSLTRHFNSSF